MSTNSFDANTFASLWTVPPSPSVGDEAIITIPAAAQVQLTLLTFTLATDANVDNRVVFLTMEDGGVSFPLGSSALAHTASNTLNYIAHQNVGLNTAAAVQTIFISIPTFRFIDPLATLKINVQDINVGDQISLIRANWKIWRGFST